jgi:hypothetical protein
MSYGLRNKVLAGSVSNFAPSGAIIATARSPMRAPCAPCSGTDSNNTQTRAFGESYGGGSGPGGSGRDAHAQALHPSPIGTGILRGKEAVVTPELQPDTWKLTAERRRVSSSTVTVTTMSVRRQSTFSATRQRPITRTQEIRCALRPLSQSSQRRLLSVGGARQQRNQVQRKEDIQVHGGEETHNGRTRN